MAIMMLCAACSSGSSKTSTAAAQRRAAAENRASKAEANAVRAEARAASRLLGAAKPAKKTTKKQHKTTPTTTYVASLAKVKHKVRTTAFVSTSADLAAIERTVTALNAAFSGSVASGITDSERANYWVGARVYTSGECSAFETARGGGVVAEDIVVHPDTLTPAPGWVDPVIGRVPQGRIYQVMIDEIQTLVTTGQRRERTMTIHVGVRPDGAGRLYLRCQ